ncbi:Imm1 family immunity protein [Lentzea aerocolonigenes]|uniref:Imm1 family immunity protein n=1 Tax=Lentzea aerocolonigenes TaxID=68170 RepID=UPI0006990FA1|nr:Imm1 family immunity protein [Lentzea aerocolonigenes]
MVALRAWYDPDADDEPIIVTSTDDADALLDKLIADSTSMQVPPLMQLSRRDSGGWAVLHVGVNADRGILTHTSAAGSSVTRNSPDPNGDPLVYDYMGHLREVPANAEIPLPDLRKALHDFVSTDGERPDCVDWQQEE